MPPDPPAPGAKSALRVTEVVVLATAMLTFISFWRAGAIVLCDMASTAWYIGGIAEQAIGKSAPWFVLAVMAFSACMLAVYVEASGMFVRGGVYKVVKEAMGSTLAKVSVSALIFDYVLTGPISAVSAGQYLAGLLNAAFPVLRIGWRVEPDLFAVLLALFVTGYFWLQNIRGIEESSEKAVRIIQLTGLMTLILFAWGGYTLWLRGVRWPPFSLTFGSHALGWLEGLDWIRACGVAGVLVGLGHAFLGMSGLESLAQVYREMEAPKLKNLKRAALFIFFFAFILTTASSFLGVALIPDSVRPKYLDNLLGGVAMNLEGPRRALLLMRAFVVVVGALILSGAVSTSIVGSNGVLNRLAEDGVMADWFRRLHPRYGTTHRMIHLVAVLQVFTILLSRGDVYILGEAYAFGVIWSFVFKTASLVILRFKDRSHRDWMVPGNIRIGGGGEKPPIQFPVGLSMIFLVLVSVAAVNLFTKKVATVWGVGFTAAFYLLFRFSERLNRRRALLKEGHREKLNLRQREELQGVLGDAQGRRRVVVAIRDPRNMHPLLQVLASADRETTDVVVVHSRRASGFQLGGGVSSMGPDEELLFTNVISAAEKQGKPVVPMMVVSNDPAYAVAQVVQAVGASEVVMGVSGQLGADLQMERMAMSLGALGAKYEQPLKIRILRAGGATMEQELV